MHQAANNVLCKYRTRTNQISENDQKLSFRNEYPTINMSEISDRYN